MSFANANMVCTNTAATIVAGGIGNMRLAREGDGGMKGK